MAFPTTSILDSGAGTDADPIAGNWQAEVYAPGANDPLKRVSNQFACHAITLSDAFWNAATFGPDTEVFVTTATLSDNNLDVVLHARLQNPHTANWTGYFMQIIPGGATLRIFRRDAGASVQLGTDATVTSAAGDSWGLEVTGSSPTTIKAYRKPSGGSWGQIGSTQTDSLGPTGAGNIGLGGSGLATRWQDYGGGTVVTGGGGSIFGEEQDLWIWCVQN